MAPGVGPNEDRSKPGALRQLQDSGKLTARTILKLNGEAGAGLEHPEFLNVDLKVRSFSICLPDTP